MLPTLPHTTKLSTTSAKVTSWQLPDEDGTYSALIVAAGPIWLRAVEALFASPEGRQALRAARMGYRTTLAIAADDARTGGASGRGIATSNETVARRVGTDPRTVRRARSILTKLGWMVTGTVGRHLTKEERATAAAIHGRKQIAAGSNRALTFPSKEAAIEAAAQFKQESAPLTQFPKGTRVTSPQSVVTKRAKRTHGEGKSKVSRPRRTLAAWKAASAIVRTHKHLDRGHLGRMADLLAPYVAAGWTAYDLTNAINYDMRERGWNTVPAAQQANPFGLFATQLRRATAGKHSPAQRRTRLRQRQQAEAAQRRQEAIDAARYAVAKPHNFDALVTAAREQADAARATTPQAHTTPSARPANFSAIQEQARRTTTAPQTPRRAPGKLAQAAKRARAAYREHMNS